MQIKEIIYTNPNQADNVGQYWMRKKFPENPAELMMGDNLH